MTFQNLEEEVAELFAEAQEIVPDITIRQALIACRAGRRLASLNNDTNVVAESMTIVNTERKRDDPARLAYLRRYEHKTGDRKIRDRILAGERPRLGGRGRPPTRWFRVAKEMGIDLTAPAPVLTDTPS